MDCCIEEGYCDFVSAPSEGRVPEFAGVEGGISEDGREKERRGIVKEMESVYDAFYLCCNSSSSTCVSIFFLLRCVLFRCWGSESGVRRKSES